MEMEPSKIGMLGFDHDYNPEKVHKWLIDGKPNIQNQFNDKKEPTIQEWADNYFDGIPTDFFYGHGTPDPMRLSLEYLKDRFERAIESAKILGVEIINCSKNPSKINTFPTSEL